MIVSQNWDKAAKKLASNGTLTIPLHWPGSKTTSGAIIVKSLRIQLEKFLEDEHADVKGITLDNDSDPDRKGDIERLLELWVYAAMSQEYLHIVEFLLACGVNVEAKNHSAKYTALLFASERSRSIELITLLLDRNADAHARVYESKSTVLHVACQYNNADIIPVSLKYGGIEARNYNSALLYSLHVRKAMKAVFEFCLNMVPTLTQKAWK